MIEEYFINLIKNIYKIIANITLNLEKCIIFSLRLGPIYGFLPLSLLSNIKLHFQAFETRQIVNKKVNFQQIIIQFQHIYFQNLSKIFCNYIIDYSKVHEES